ncbi:ABC transporter transmembrane domain-containing protein [Glutamicibacter sp. AOP38-B1-38]|uniref:ABC transporter transmembrane domain-containing protein n=1 Tax=Glutamicibacter sp. AOP38-B1-38 TaxID=3457680 RepID=UPI0040339292
MTGSQPVDPPTIKEPSLPALLAPGRRGLLAALLALALGVGALSIAIAWQVGQLATAFGLGALTWVIVLSLAFFCAKFIERVLAERLGQHYVAQLRGSLISHALKARRGPSVGITVARSSNDLSSIRNWVTQGIVPLLAGIPLIVFAALGLGALHPLLAAALVLPVLLEVGLLAFLARGALRTARVLRRHRGNLAARIADTVTAATTIAAGGGVRREVERVDRSSQKVVQAAVDRAKYAGALRAGSLTVPLLGTALVVAAGSWAGLGAGTLASALTLMGICAGTMGEWGRIVEYRQNYRAGRRIIAPLLHAEKSWSIAEQKMISTREVKDLNRKEITVRIRPTAPGLENWPVLRAHAGQRIQVVGPGAESGALLESLATGRITAHGDSLGGLWIAEGRSEDLPATERRKLIGAALSSMVPERGTIIRALTYRHPGSSVKRALRVAADCGLELGPLPAAERTMLRRGGEPLDSAQRACLIMARALLRQPPVLILDPVLNRLPSAAREAVIRKLNEYPGVVIFQGEIPGLEATGTWQAPLRVGAHAENPAPLEDAE